MAAPEASGAEEQLDEIVNLTKRANDVFGAASDRLAPLRDENPLAVTADPDGTQGPGPFVEPGVCGPECAHRTRADVFIVHEHHLSEATRSLLDGATELRTIVELLIETQTGGGGLDLTAGDGEQPPQP